jgi:hypothetical protein
MPAPGEPGSTLLLDEYFESGDPRFLDELLAANASKNLRAFGVRWFADTRPFAREMLVRYIDDGCLRRGHRALVKTLFKRAEAANDDEAMIHFMVAIDSMPRRKLVDGYRYDYTARRSIETKVLAADPAVPGRVKADENAATFTRRTRQYLARRAWRYFRKIGRKDSNRYRRAMESALPRYRDEALAKPEQLMDAWSLLHALYWSAPSLERRPSGVRLRPNTSLADLIPAPIYAPLWYASDGFEPLLGLVLGSKSRTVRGWAISILKDKHSQPLRSLELPRVQTLLRSPHEEVLALGADLLRNVSGLETLAIGEWLELLAIDNASVVALVSELVAKHVAPDRLTLAQCVDLAGAKAAPVAELGLRWARTKPIRRSEDLDVLTRLANIGVPIVRAEATTWVLGLVERESFSKPEHVREFIDSRYADTRRAALAFLAANARFRDQLALWSALAESPYDDARDALVVKMDAWSESMPAQSLRHLWATAILAIHRGSRKKPLVLKQIADRIAGHPDEVSSLLPLFRHALRSVRPTERRAAIAAVARAAHRAPALRAQIGRELPELQLWAPEV